MSNDGHHLFVWTKARKPILSLILGAYLTSAFIAASPMSAFTKMYCQYIGVNLNRLGLFSNFGVFGANPEDFNQEFEAVVKLTDGSTKSWILPHLTQWKDRPSEIQKKFFWSEWQIYFMAIPSPAREALWRDAAIFAARLYRNPSNQPVKVTLWRRFSMLVPEPPDSPLPVEGPEQTQRLLDYDVRTEDLQ